MIRFAYITASNIEEAKRIGHGLLSKKLVACVNIIDGMQSMYWWEGEIEESKETVLIAKTTADKMDAVIDEVKSMHTYSVPCVLSIPIEKGSPGYISWLKDSVQKPQT